MTLKKIQKDPMTVAKLIEMLEPYRDHFIEYIDCQFCGNQLQLYPPDFSSDDACSVKNYVVRVYEEDEEKNRYEEIKYGQ